MFSTLLMVLLWPGSCSLSIAWRSAIHRSATVTRPMRGTALLMADSVVVTDGTDSFFGSRGVFQAIFDHGDFGRITALSSCISDAKKMLLSRQVINSQKKHAHL